jgi:hypothetical protein
LTPVDLTPYLSDILKNPIAQNAGQFIQKMGDEPL